MKAAKKAALAREHRDADTAMSQAIRAELDNLHVTTSFASPSSHLYHESDAFCPRPPAGVQLNPSSNLKHVQSSNPRKTPLLNILGVPQRLPSPALTLTSAGILEPESYRAIMARGGATSKDILPEDAELKLYEAAKGTLAERAAMTKGSAAEIMSRDT